MGKEHFSGIVAKPLKDISKNFRKMGKGQFTTVLGNQQ